MMNKSVAFSYLIDRFLDWFREVRPGGDYESKFTKLFLLKQLFLVSAIKTNNHTDLLDLFDNFHALPYGPVESDIYNQIANDKIPNYTITDRGIIKKEFFKELSLSAENIQKLDNSLKMLRGKNDNLIVLPAFTLVDITHKWESWDKAFKYAKFIGSGSTKMNIEHIRNDKVHYFGN